MRRLREQIRQKGQICGKKVLEILHHYNTPSHKIIIVNKFITKHSTSAILQPPYSPDMARHIRPICFFFPKLKLPLCGARSINQRNITESWTQFPKKNI